MTKAYYMIPSFNAVGVVYGTNPLISRNIDVLNQKHATVI